MLLLEEEEEEERAGWREETRREEGERRRTRADKLATLPRESIWTPRPLLTSKGHGATQPFILIMEEAETASHNMALPLCHAACHLPSPSTAITQASAQHAASPRPPLAF